VGVPKSSAPQDDECVHKPGAEEDRRIDVSGLRRAARSTNSPTKTLGMLICLKITAPMSVEVLRVDEI